MAHIEELLLKDLPDEVIGDAASSLAPYSIGFVRIEDTPNGQDAVLLGSGTLVSVAGIRAILTAHHVVSVLPRQGRLGLILDPTPRTHTVDVRGLTYLPIARGGVDALGPDLGAVILAPSIAAAIAAKKSFYNLDSRRDQQLNAPLDPRDGFWFTNGFIDEYTVTHPAEDGRGLVKGFYNLSGAGGPEDREVRGGYDYHFFPVSYSERSIAPKRFNGMSGGGVWQVPLARDDDGTIRHKRPLLSGVVFYQEPTSETTCGVRCHGRASVYDAAYKAIQLTQRQSCTS